MNQSAHFAIPKAGSSPTAHCSAASCFFQRFTIRFRSCGIRIPTSVETEVLGWAVRHALVRRGGKGEAMLRSLGPADIIGRMYYRMDREAFLASSIRSAWMFLVDAHFCEVGAYHGSPNGLAQFHLWLRAILSDPRGCGWRSMFRKIVCSLPAEYAELCIRTGKPTADMAQRIAKVSSPMQYVRWMDALTFYFLYSFLAAIALSV
ncbi:hypothetical protein ACKWRH_45590 (plasmid) [Bradyrhizobium sp. Pa8]|uniref:hypothetical protein n=1 Tax=Bradyrhizobium sp. Pa8 TaxID=3386552 RepID=UPI00403F652D